MRFVLCILIFLISLPAFSQIAGRPGFMAAITKPPAASEEIPSDITNGMVFYYPLENGLDNFPLRTTNAVGTTVMQYSNTPCPVPGLTALPGQVGYGLHFNGQNTELTSQTAITTNSIEQRFTNAFSVSFWFRQDEQAAVDPRLVGATNDTPWVFLTDRYPSATNLQFHVKRSDGTTHTLLSSKYIQNHSNYWAVGVYDGTNTYLYMDGQLDKSFTTNVASVLLNANGSIQLGHYFDPSFICCGFVGTLDEVRGYNRALSASEIAQQFQLYTNYPAIPLTTPLEVLGSQFFKLPYWTNGAFIQTNTFNSSYDSAGAAYGTWTSQDGLGAKPQVLNQTRYASGTNIPLLRPAYVVGTTVTNTETTTNWIETKYETNLATHQFLVQTYTANSVYQMFYRFYMYVDIDNGFVAQQNNLDFFSIFGFDPGGYLVTEWSWQPVSGGGTNVMGMHVQSPITIPPLAKSPIRTLCEVTVVLDGIRGYGRIVYRNAFTRNMISDIVGSGIGTTPPGIGIFDTRFNFNYLTLTVAGTNKLAAMHWGTNLQTQALFR